METEITLLGTFIIALVVIKIRRKEVEFALAGRIAMSAMLLLTSVAHFIFTKGMAMMLPDFLPFRMELVYLTGVIEFVAAVGLLIPNYQVKTAWWLIAFLILILPSNIYASIKHVNLQTANLDGEGLTYLWYRIPLQLFYIGWIYLSAIKPKTPAIDHPVKEE